MTTLPIEKQVVSRELSEELKKAGYPQEGAWWWVRPDAKDNVGKSEWDLLLQNKSGYVGYKNRILAVAERFVAPTVAELGERLKKHPSPEYCLDAKKWLWFATISNDDIDDNTEANARAKMWLYLNEKGLL